MQWSRPSKALDGLLSLRPAARYLVFALLGALTALVFAPAGWFMLAPILVLPLLGSCLRDAPRVAAKNGFFYGAGLFLAGTYWLYISIHVFGQAPLALAILLMVALVLLMAVYYAIAAALTAFLAGASAWRLLLVAPAVWVLLEWVRGWLFTGFPWLTLGYSQVDSVLSGWAPLAGVYGVSAVLMISAVALLLLMLPSSTRRWPVLVLLVLPWLAGWGLGKVQWTSPSGEPVVTSIIQGGIGQDRKWLPEQFRPTLDLYRETTDRQRSSELIVWPEVAIPSLVDRVEPYLSMVELGLVRRGASLVMGILERDHNGEHVYNSALLLGNGDIQVYRKRHLVPFGEYFPVPETVREWMRLMSIPVSDLSPGEENQPLLRTVNGLELAVAICYEDAYGAEQLYALPDADLLINISNDAWFGDSVAPHQHLEIARMRAVEAGRYVIRATNTGVSAFIGPSGQILESAPQFELAVMQREVVPHSGLTPYARTGNWPVIALAAVVIIGGFVRRK
jgi:apolipoprotein N-acyltransferase